MNLLFTEENFLNSQFWDAATEYRHDSVLWRYFSASF